MKYLSESDIINVFVNYLNIKNIISWFEFFRSMNVSDNNYMTEVKMIKKKKEFFLRFGYKGDSLDKLAEDVSAEIGMFLSEIDDMFLGKSMIYEGPLADKVMASPNYFEQDDIWMCEEHKECPIIMTCVFTSGTKDIENEIKAEFLKNALNNVNDMVFIDLESREPKEFDIEEVIKKMDVKDGKVES